MSSSSHRTWTSMRTLAGFFGTGTYPILTVSWSRRRWTPSVERYARVPGTIKAYYNQTKTTRGRRTLGTVRTQAPSICRRHDDTSSSASTLARSRERRIQRCLLVPYFSAVCRRKGFDCLDTCIMEEKVSSRRSFPRVFLGRKPGDARRV